MLSQNYCYYCPDETLWQNILVTVCVYELKTNEPWQWDHPCSPLRSFSICESDLSMLEGSETNPFSMWILIMCRSQYGCPFTPIPHHSLLFGWPCTLLSSSETSVSSGVQGSKNQWLDQRWQIMKEEELNVIHSCANNLEEEEVLFIMALHFRDCPYFCQ